MLRPSVLFLAGLTAAVSTAPAQTPGTTPRDTVLWGAIIAAEDARADDMRSLDPLVRGVQSPDPFIRRLAVRALGRFERPALVFGIAPLLSDPDPAVRAEATNAMGQAVYRGDASMVGTQLMARLIGERDPGVRGVIAQTLGRLPYRLPDEIRTAETAVLSVASDTGAALYGAVRGIESLVRRNVSSTPPSPSTIARLRELVAARGPDTLTLRVRHLAMATLVAAGRLDTGLATQALRDPDSEIRRLVAGTNFVADSLPAALVAVLNADPSPPVRFDALRAFGRRRLATDGCAVVLGAARDTNPQIALQALDLLGNRCGSGTESAAAFLAAEARRLRSTLADTGWHRPAHALVSLARIAPDSAERLLQLYSRHNNWFVRMYAARAAAAIKDSATLRRLAGDAQDNVREAAVTGLVAVEGHGADSVYLAQLIREDYQLLRTAAQALDSTPDTTAAVALLTSLRRVSREQRETSRDARRALLDRWARLAPRDQLEGVLKFYLSDYDTLIARQAADLLASRFGVTYRPTPKPLPIAPTPTPGDLLALDRWTATIHMRGGGDVVLRLRPFDAPVSVARFARLLRAGYFNGLTFHRIAPNFVVQGGSPGANEYWGDAAFARDEITMEPHLRNRVGISTRGRDTGDAQIFVNLIDNWRLDFNYTIIAEVVSGMDVVDRMLEGSVIERIEFK